MRINKDILKNTLLEYSLGELKTASEEKRVSRAKNMIIRYQGVTSGDDGHARTIWEVPSQTGDGSYRVMVAFEPKESDLFSLSKGKWDLSNFSKILSESDVKVHCTCKDFLFGGAKYNLGKYGNYSDSAIKTSSGYKNETDVISDAPDVRDPNRKNIMCKHLIAVSNRFTANTSRIMSQIRKYTPEDDTKIQIRTSLNEAKSVKLINVSDEENTKITDSIVSSNSDVELSDNRMNDDIVKDVVESDTELNVDNKLDPQEVVSYVSDDNDATGDDLEEYISDVDSGIDDDELNDKDVDVDDLLDRYDEVE